jgi:hypothetical protein
MPTSAATLLPSPPPLDTLVQVQTRRLRCHAAACCAWLVVCALTWFGGLAAAGTPLTPALLALGGFVPLTGLALLASPVRPARRYTLNIVAATLFLPIGLLFAATSLDLAPARPMPPGLDLDRLYAGAVAIEEVEPPAGMVRLRQGRFADGSELRLLRFIDLDTASRHLAMLGEALGGEPYVDHGRRGVRMRSGVMPGALALLEQHGADVLELRARDVAGGLARLARQQVPTPVATAAEPAATTSAARWSFFVAAALAHAAAFVALIVWGGRWTTRVPAPTGLPPVNAAALRARLESFAASPRAPFLLAEAGADRVVVDLPVGALRSHRITLVLCADRHEVRVSERIGVHGDRPRDAAEASLRSLGDPAFDPTRPQADRVWQTTWQATLVDPARLAAVPLRPLGLHAELPSAYAAALDGEGLLTALCALVTRSGWHWQPRLGAA